MDYDRDDAVSLLRAAERALWGRYGPAGPLVGDLDPDALRRLADQIGAGSLIAGPSRPASIEEERADEGWTQEVRLFPTRPEPDPPAPAGYTLAPGGAGRFLHRGIVWVTETYQSGVGPPHDVQIPLSERVRWLVPAEAPNG